MKNLKLFEKYLGCIWGLAAGDAFAFPVEFMNRNEINKKFGSDGIRYMSSSGIYHADEKGKLSDIGTYSDDTQMSLAVARGLLKSKTDSIDEIMENISKEFIAWKNSPENNRSPGTTCMSGIKNIESGMSWRQSGIKGSYGCGAAMRTAPIGLAYFKNLDKLKEISSASAIITHNSDVAIASAIANAYLVAHGIMQKDYKKSLTDLIEFTKGISPVFTSKIYQIKKVMHLSSEEALDILGKGWEGHEAMACALYCALKNDFRYDESVKMAANTNGDSDSIACIAGGIIGAYQGRYGIPHYFLRPLENRDGLLFQTALDLYEKFVEKN